MKESRLKSQVTLSRLANKTKNLNLEILSLTQDNQSKEAHITDMQQSLRLNKQAAHILFSQQITKLKGDQGRTFSRLRIVLWENMRLLQEISKERRMKEEATAEFLISQQIAIQEQQTFQTIIEQRFQRIDDLRKTQHDKEYNYHIISDRLAQYEDLEELTISANNVNAIDSFAEANLIKLMARLSHEKQQQQQQILQLQKSIMELKKEESRLTETVIQESNYDSVVGILSPLNKSQSQRNLSIIEQNVDKDMTSTSNTISHKPKIKTTTEFIQLLKLLKKEKVENRLMKESVKDSADVYCKVKKDNQRLRQKAQKNEQKLQEYGRNIRNLDKCLKKALFGRKSQLQYAQLKRIGEQCVQIDDGKSPEIIDSVKNYMIKCSTQPSM